jgi:hypothetical protein
MRRLSKPDTYGIIKKLLSIIENITLIKNETSSFDFEARRVDTEEYLKAFYLYRIKYSINYLSRYLDLIGEDSYVELVCVNIEDSSDVILFSEWTILDLESKSKYATTNWITCNISDDTKSNLDKHLGFYSFY